MQRLQRYFVLEPDDQAEITLVFRLGKSTWLAWFLIILTATCGVLSELLPDLQHVHLLPKDLPAWLNNIIVLGGWYSYYVAGVVFFFFWQLSRWLRRRQQVAPPRRTGLVESFLAIIIITYLGGVLDNWASQLGAAAKIKDVADSAESLVTVHGSAWQRFVTYMSNNWYELPSEDVFRLSLFTILFVALWWINRPTLRYWLAFLMTALLFGAWHYSSYGYNLPEAVFEVGLPTIVDGCLWLRTRNLWTFTASHFLYDYSGNF